MFAGSALASAPDAPANSASKNAFPPLFDDLRFGFARTDALKLPGAAPGEGEFAESVMLSEARFAGLPWTARLDFAPWPKAEKLAPPGLVRVALIETYTKERLEKVNSWLAANGFELLAMEAEGKRLDFLAILKSFGTKELQKRIGEFYKRDDAKMMAFAWFKTADISREMKITVRNLTELMHVIAAETLEAEVALLGPGDGKISHIIVGFGMPVLELQTFGATPKSEKQANK